MSDLDVIIPFRRRSARCFPNLKWVVDRILSMGCPGKLRVCVVDNDTGRRHKLLRNVEWLFLAGEFNKAWACNYGFRQTEAEYVAFIDGDIVLPQEAFNIALKKLGDECLGGKLYRGVYNLSLEDSDRILETSPLLPLRVPRSYESKRLRGGNRAGGAFYVTRDIYRKVRGFNEAYVPLGGVDIDLTERLAALDPKWGSSPNPGLHLYHQRSDQRSRNQLLTRWCVSLDRKGLKQYILDLPKGFGDPAGPRGFRPESLR